jgi:hypothetical protein
MGNGGPREPFNGSDAAEAMREVGVKNIFGAVEIASQRCFVEGCEGRPEFAAPRQTPEGVKVVSACGPHQSRLDREHDAVTAMLQTCRAGEDEPCSGAATQLVIAGIDGGELRLISSCDRHAERLVAQRRLSVRAPDR